MNFYLRAGVLSTAELRPSSSLSLTRFALLLLLILMPSLAALAQSITYSPPIVIRQGGTYSGNWQSLDSNVPAVRVETTEPVIIENANISSAGHLIHVLTGTNVTIRNCRGYGLTPTIDNFAHGRFVNARRPRNLVVEHNLFENTTGVYVHEVVGNGSENETIKIRYNKSRNINGLHRNGTSRTLVQFVQFNMVQKMGNMEIAWNDVLNEPGLSSVEDNINIYNTNATPESPLLIHNNFIKGGYPADPMSTYYTGGGIITDGSATGTTATAYVHAFENVVISTTNHGMGLASGNNVQYYNNRVVSSGLYADGTRIPAQFGGMWIRNYYNKDTLTTFHSNQLRNNVIGWVKFNTTLPGQLPDRRDLSLNTCTTCLGNTHLPNPITLETEEKEYQDWVARCQAANIVPGLLAAPPALSVQLTSPESQASFKEGSNVALSASVTAADAIAPVSGEPNKKGNNGKNSTGPGNPAPEVTVKKVAYFRGSYKIGEATTAPYATVWHAAPAGTHTLTAVATDLDWNTTTSQAITVTIIPNEVPVVSAGADQTIMLPSTSVTLQGSATDPDGSIRNLAWTQRSGPTATLTGTTTATLGLNDLTEGTYVFRLTATDDFGASAFDDATVTVIPRANQAPVVSFAAPAPNSTHPEGEPITITVAATDQDGELQDLSLWADGTLLATSTTAPFTFSWRGVEVGTYTLTAIATDNEGASTTSEAMAVRVQVVPTTVMVPPTHDGTWQTGTILREYWANVAGATVAQVPQSTLPSSTGHLSVFEGPSNAANTYASRIRGYVHPPLSGHYTFWLAADDQAELWLSTDDNPARKVRIAYLNSPTKGREWKAGPQQSAPIALEAGKRYYIEALHKEDKATDHLAVGWQLPNNTQERPIPGSRLSPFDAAAPTLVATTSGSILREVWTNVNGSQVWAIPVQSVPTRSEQLTVLEGPQNEGDQYGARLRGYLLPPQTGDYTFWLSGDESAELWLSSDATETKKIRIASLASASGFRQKNLFASQQSAPVRLEAGKPYYLEVLHKEGLGEDHVSAGWQLPDGTEQMPIKGSQLAPVVFLSPSAASASSAKAVTGEVAGSGLGEENTSLLRLYPNPGTDAVMLTAPADPAFPTTVRLTSLTGSVYFLTTVAAGPETIKLPLNLRELNLASGIYLVHVQTGNRSSVARLVKTP